MFRRKPKAPRPLDVLVRDLEDLHDVDVRADMWAFEIHHGGNRAVQRCLARMAGEFGLGYMGPLAAAFAKYEEATTGRDLAAVVPDFVRQRRAGPDLQAALDNQVARVARVNQRLAHRQLAAVRAIAHHRGGENADV